MMDYYYKYKTDYLELKQYQSGGGKIYGHSNVWVFDRLNNIITEIPYTLFNNKIHLIINDNELNILASENAIKIDNFIKNRKGYKKKFYHVSTTTINNLYNKDSDHTSWVGEGLYNNPQGIWISCGLSWQKYIGTGVSQWSLANYIYEIVPSKKVLYIHSIEELKKFIDDYKKKTIKITNIINWKKVKKRYDGLIICPYLGDKIWGKKSNRIRFYGNKKQLKKHFDKILEKDWKTDIFYLAEWYRHWETGSGVIWRMSGIANIKLLTKLNTFDHIIDR